MNEHNATAASADEWFYAAGGSRVGPVTRPELLDLLKSGKVGRDDIVWNGQMADWKPAVDTDLWKEVGGGSPPPLPASHVSNHLAWALVAVPLVGALLEKVLVSSMGELPLAGVAATYFAVNSALTLWDAHQIEQGGHDSERVNLRIWFWLVPVYLYKRAIALGQKLHYFAAWCVTFAASLLVAQPELFSSSTYWGTGTPACDSHYATSQVKTIFADIPLVRTAGIRALEVNNARQSNEVEGNRTCLATVRASNGNDVNVAYSIDKRGDQFYIYVNIQP